MGNIVSSPTRFSYGETTCSNSTPTITKCLTVHPPSSYSVKIENLTQLNIEKYQSRRFTVGGYDWRLIIYPKGNNEENGGGYISMYVEIDSTSEVFAYLKFFVYNKKERKYFTVQDTEVQRFNALRKVWGISQMVPLNLFNYPSNGYVFEGYKSEFGVDVMVVPPLTKWEVFSFYDDTINPKFIWKLQHLSGLKKNMYISNKFSMGGRKWVLNVHPKGDPRVYGRSLSIFLRIADEETLLEDEKIYLHADVRVLDPRGSNHVTHTVKAWFKKPPQGWGWGDFLSLAKLREAYLDEDTLTVEVESKFYSATNYSLP